MILKLVTTLCALIFGAAALAQTPNEPKPRLVVGMAGGLLGQELRGIIDDYLKTIGAEAAYVEGTTTDLLAKVRAQRNAPQIDFFIGNDRTFALAKSLGLLEKLDPQLVPNLTKVRPEFRDRDGFGQFFQFMPVGYVYRTDKFAEAQLPPPTSWTVFEAPALKGRAILPPLTLSYGYYFLIGLALDEGGGERDISSAWPKLERMVANGAIVAATPGQAETMTQRGEGWIYVAHSLRADLARAQGLPVAFAIPKGRPMAVTDFMSPVRGAKGVVLAQRVLNHLLSAEVQLKRSSTSAVGPVNAEVELTPELKARLGLEAQQPLPSFYAPDPTVINANLDAWFERFNRIVAR